MKDNPDICKALDNDLRLLLSIVKKEAAVAPPMPEPETVGAGKAAGRR
jgi:hypothetical protein